MSIQPRGCLCITNLALSSWLESDESTSLELGTVVKGKSTQYTRIASFTPGEVRDREQTCLQLSSATGSKNTSTPA